MKKIAFYVEGLTEQLFINKLLIEIAGQKNIEIKLERFQGAGKNCCTEIYPKTTSQPSNPRHHALIFDCAGDGGVKSRMLEDYQRLFLQGYTEIVGLLDLYPRTDLQLFQSNLRNGVVRNGVKIALPLPINTSIIIAVREVESWFLAECKHFQFVDTILTNSFIVSRVGFDPCNDDMTTRDHPAEDLHAIYQLAGKSYLDGKNRKRKNKIERTVECLDYSDIYLTLGRKINELDELICKIDNFLV
ncbi:MAG: hypothetical protein IPH35_03985 [Rhodoferax sp.]|nr:hypothetical protein [Rhodoferax sp.]